MCTLIVFDRVVPGRPLVVASNRDEYFSRPAASPARVAAQEGRPAFVAPQDLEGGGTWMGLNARGLFVGLTNRHSMLAPQAKQQSRGLLVRDALGHLDAQSVARELDREDLADSYRPFHMLYSDAQNTFLTSLREDGAETQELAPGIHVVGNRDPADPTAHKVRSTQKAVEQLDLDLPLESRFEALARLLRSHEGGDDPLHHVCVHTPSYGTRSSTILSLGEDEWRYWHSEGAPCQGKYRDYSGLLTAMRQAP